MKKLDKVDFFLAATIDQDNNSMTVEKENSQIKR